MSEPDIEPKDVIQQVGLHDLVTALENLIRTQPTGRVIRAALELALVSGVYAGEHRQAKGEAFTYIERDLRAAKILGSIWGDSGYDIR